MDERHGQITEGAGLEESRLNTELLDWLNRWGSTILLVVLVVAVSYVGWNWWQRRQVTQVDNAFYELNAAMETGDPAGLVAVAQEWSGQGAVAEQARLAAAELHLTAAIRGVAPGVDLSAESLNEEQLLSEEQRQEHYDRARSLYEQVLQRSGNQSDLSVHALRAKAGLASVAISRGEVEGGRSLLKETAEQAREAGYAGLAEALQSRIETLDEAQSLPPLRSESDLHAYQAEQQQQQQQQRLDGLNEFQPLTLDGAESGEDESMPPGFTPLAPPQPADEPGSEAEGAERSESSDDGSEPQPEPDEETGGGSGR